MNQINTYFSSPPRGVWFIGPVPIRAYALFILLGIFISLYWGNKRWIARGGKSGDIESLAIWMIPLGILGGRLYHLATDWRTYFAPNSPRTPLDALKIWDGGMGIWGAVLLGAVGAWIGCRRLGLNLLKFADAIGPTVLLAQAIGRMGNYFNQELFGRPTKMPWGLIIYERVYKNTIGYDDIDGVSNGVIHSIVQPTFLYELLWDVFIVLVLIYIDRKYKLVSGGIFALYVAGYCFGRFFVELLRSDYATHIFGLRINTITSTLVFILAWAWLIYMSRKQKTKLFTKRALVNNS